MNLIILLISSYIKDFFLYFSLSKPIGPPDKLIEPLDNENLKLVAQRLYELGYYYEKNPEKEDIEYTLAPNYLGIVGMASNNPF